MRDRGGRERRGVKGGERRGAGSHIARLRAVNNLEEHWGDETKMNTKHWQRLTQSCSYISEYHRAESSPSAALPPSLPPPRLPSFFFCSSSASLCVWEETAVRYSCFASHSMKLNRIADNSASRGSLSLSASVLWARQESQQRPRLSPAAYVVGGGWESGGRADT